MCNYPECNWRSHWTVDLELRTAWHTDGWCFLFERPDHDPKFFDGLCVSYPTCTALDASRIVRICQESGKIFGEAVLAEREKRHKSITPD